MMLLPATNALERCQGRGDEPELPADQGQFAMGVLYDQAMALDIPFVQPFPIIAWPKSCSDSECIIGTEVVKTQTVKKSLRRRRYKHRMVRSKSQYKGLCCLGGSSMSL